MSSASKQPQKKHALPTHLRIRPIHAVVFRISEHVGRPNEAGYLIKLDDNYKYGSGSSIVRVCASQRNGTIAAAVTIPTTLLLY